MGMARGVARRLARCLAFDTLTLSKIHHRALIHLAALMPSSGPYISAALEELPQ
jgi:hypothetical protein